VSRSGPELVAELRAAFGAADPERIAAILHDDFEIEQPASLPHGGRHLGMAGMAEMGARFAEHWERTIGPPVVHDGGDVVVQVTTQTWTSRATGRSATVDVVELISVADDRIRGIRVFQQDTALLLATLDAD
jgi:uncharacterized protein